MKWNRALQVLFSNVSTSSLLNDLPWQISIKPWYSNHAVRSQYFPCLKLYWFVLFWWIKLYLVGHRQWSTTHFTREYPLSLSRWNLIFIAKAAPQTISPVAKHHWKVLRQVALKNGPRLYKESNPKCNHFLKCSHNWAVESNIQTRALAKAIGKFITMRTD